MHNRVVAGEWQRTVVLKTTYGAYPRLTFNEDAWIRPFVRIHSADCCGIGECGLYRALSSLPAQRALFKRHIFVAKELGRLHVQHMRAGTGHPISDVMCEPFAILVESTHRQNWVHVSWYIADLTSSQRWIGRFRKQCARCSQKSV